MTKLSQIEIAPDGTVQVRLWKPGSDEQHPGGYHRTIIPPGTDPKAQFDAVDAHLVAMGYPPLDDRSMVLDAVNTFQTPARVKAYAARVKAGEDALKLGTAGNPDKRT